MGVKDFPEPGPAHHSADGHQFGHGGMAGEW